MLKAPIPADDSCRLDSLRSLEILDTPAEGRFDRITRLARRIFGVPIAAISLVDEARQWFKSIDGLPVRETPRDISFCGHAIHGDDALVVENATNDERFHDNPLVTGDPKIRFYAGHPLVGPSGAKLGTLCVIDNAPRSLSDNDLLTLQDLAALVENELSLDRMSRTQRELVEQLETAQKQAMIDPLTQFWNRAGLERVLDSELSRALRGGTTLSLAVADIDHFKSINDTHGHAAGDDVLREVARRIRTALRATDACGRIGGEEFVLVHPECDSEAAARLAERIRMTIGGETIVVGREPDTHAIPVTLSLGVASTSPSNRLGAVDLIDSADQAMYRAKHGGRDRVVLASRQTVEPEYEFA